VIARLRLKIEQDARQPKYLLTVHGVGYRLTPGEHQPAGKS
jgi:DNA-binding response OmpR family regulator